MFPVLSLVEASRRERGRDSGLFACYPAFIKVVKR